MPPWYVAVLLCVPTFLVMVAIDYLLEWGVLGFVLILTIAVIIAVLLLPGGHAGRVRKGSAEEP